MKAVIGRRLDGTRLEPVATDVDEEVGAADRNEPMSRLAGSCWTLRDQKRREISHGLLRNWPARHVEAGARSHHAIPIRREGNSLPGAHGPALDPGVAAVE